MARYAYDVNTTQRYIDVHKQFQGGLKTVDTDDALGAVFLRQAENVSLSEFGFIEKRYGTFENFKKQISGNLQGYWEFYGNIVYAVDGNIYLNDNKITTFYKVGSARYPLFSEVFTQGNFQETAGNVKITNGAPFQITRDMNAINISNVLYIFTGTYPIYLVKEDNFFLFYLFPIETPTYDEIVVTGHNLLEDRYSELYGFSTPNSYQIEGKGITTASTSIQSANYYPRIPYQQNGKINFQFLYSLDSSQYSQAFTGEDFSRFYTIDLESVKYRRTGAGFSEGNYITATKPNFQIKTNYQGTSDFLLRNGEPLVARTALSSAEQVFSSSVDSREVTELGQTFTEYWTNNKYQLKTSDNFTKEVYLEHKNQIFVFEEQTTDVNQIYKPLLFQDLKSRIEALIQVTNNTTNTAYRVVITPYASDGSLFSENRLIIASDQIQALEGIGYQYQIPEDIVQTDEITGYNVSFQVTITYKSTAASFVAIPQNRIEQLNLGLTKSLETFSIIKPPGAGNVISNPNNYPSINFELSSLLTGTYDFEVTFALRKYTYVNGFLDFNTPEDGVVLFSRNFYNITITSQQLQDYPGVIDYPKLKPIWTCNKVIEHFNKLMIWGSEEMPTAVFYSFPDRPFYFPSKFYLDFVNDENSAVQSVASYMNILVVQTEDRTWGVRGNSGILDSPSPYLTFTINPTVGTIAYKSVRPVRNHLFFLSKQGIIALKSLYAADEQYNIDFMDRNIFNIVPQDSEAVGIQYDNQYWLNFPNFGITLRWYIDKKAWVQDKFNTWDDFNGVFKWQIVNGKLEFITHPSRFEPTGNQAIYKIGIDYSLPTDLGSAVVAKFETSFLNQNYPFHPKNYKEAKMDFTLQNEYNSGRLPVYEMDTNEDIVGNIHTIQDGLLKNHRYRLEYDFTLQETVIVDGGTYSSVFDDSLDGGLFTGSNFEPNPLDLFYYYVVGSISINGTFLELFPFSYETVEFLLPNDIGTNEDLIIFGDFTNYSGGAYLRDVTYDDVLNFNTWVISEDQTLNIDNYEGYDPSLVNVGLDLTLKDRLGDWIFGTSDFGNKVTAVKTIKLSGKGYNSKIYIEDYSKSKWTLESLGITYKMKRARSR